MTSTPTSRRGCAGRRTIACWTSSERRTSFRAILASYSSRRPESLEVRWHRTRQAAPSLRRRCHRQRTKFASSHVLDPLNLSCEGSRDPARGIIYRSAGLPKFLKKTLAVPALLTAIAEGVDQTRKRYVMTAGIAVPISNYRRLDE